MFEHIWCQIKLREQAQQHVHIFGGDYICYSNAIKCIANIIVLTKLIRAYSKTHCIIIINTATRRANLIIFDGEHYITLEGVAEFPNSAPLYPKMRCIIDRKKTLIKIVP